MARAIVSTTVQCSSKLKCELNLIHTSITMHVKCCMVRDYEERQA